MFQVSGHDLREQPATASDQTRNVIHQLTGTDVDTKDPLHPTQLREWLDDAIATAEVDWCWESLREISEQCLQRGLGDADTAITRAHQTIDNIKLSAPETKNNIICVHEKYVYTCAT